VEVLLESVRNHYPLARRWFGIKAGLLGLPKLHLYDQYAPLGQPAIIKFAEAWEKVDRVTRHFSTDVYDVVRAFLVDRRIDAEPRTGKRGGAFCAPVAWGDNPYILANFTDDIYSAETLAHEAGHGLHFVLSGRKQAPISAGTGIAMAEVASTFLQALFVDYVLEKTEDADQRRLLSARQIEGFCAVVFRQTMMTGYEDRAYAMKNSGMALTRDRLSDIWFEENANYYGDSVELPDAYRYGWAYIPHFIDTRFYTYAYSFAHLASMALYAKYRQEGKVFVPTFLNLLAAGGSEAPSTLLQAAGIDISDPSWAAPSFREVERLIGEFEALDG
jgi:oligoendopeptidase F